MDRIFGIDLGTTNSVIAHTDPNGMTEVIAGKDGDRIVPSVVYFPKGGGDPIVGKRAKERAVIEPDRVAKLFKRGMGERTFLPGEQPFVVDGKAWSPEELSALVLRKLAQMAADYYGEPARRAIVTVPAYFGDAEREATKTAGELAGLDVLRVLNEPTAAAFAHGLDRPGEPGRILVFDLGGGTFDVTIMDLGNDGSMNVVGTGGDRELGGMDFDKLIVDEMAKMARQANLDLAADLQAEQDAYLKAEEIKKELSDLDEAMKPITAAGRPLAFELTRSSFEGLLKEKLQAVEDITLHTIETAGTQPSEITKVLMTGGSSRIPAFQKLLAQITCRQPTFSRSLDEDVARGAAILATKEGGELDPRAQLASIPAPKDVLSHGLGITALNPDTMALYNSIIIPAQTPVPAENYEEMYETVEEGQTRIDVKFNEGDEEDLEFVTELGRGPANFGRAVPKGYPIRVVISCTKEGTLTLRAFDGNSGAELRKIEKVYPNILSAEEKRAALSDMARIRVR